MWILGVYPGIAIRRMQGPILEFDNVFSGASCFSDEAGREKNRYPDGLDEPHADNLASDPRTSTVTPNEPLPGRTVDGGPI